MQKEAQPENCEEQIPRFARDDKSRAARSKMAAWDGGVKPPLLKKHLERTPGVSYKVGPYNGVEEKC